MHGKQLLETAEKLGISESYLSLLERNLRPMSPEIAIKIEKKLGIPRGDLL
jgi:transcriptional regulator with XRE-family HTH domain